MAVSVIFFRTVLVFCHGKAMAILIFHSVRFSSVLMGHPELSTLSNYSGRPLIEMKKS